MTQPENPFAQTAATPATAPAAATNPFGQAMQQPPAQVPPANPFPPAAAAAPANPFGAPAPQAAPTQQQWAPAAPAQPTQQQWAAGAATYPPAAPPTQTYAPAQPAAAAPPPALDPNSLRGVGAPPPSGGKGAQLPDMYGRLVVMFPMQVDTVPRRPEHITAEQRAQGNVMQQRLTATVVVLDMGPGTPPGGTIAWGGAPHKLPPVAHTNNDPLPYVRKGMWINQTKIVEQARPFLPAGPGVAPGMMVGRPVKVGPEQNAAWYLATPSDAEIQLAQQYVAAVIAGALPHPLAP